MITNRFITFPTLQKYCIHVYPCYHGKKLINMCNNTNKIWKIGQKEFRCNVKNCPVWKRLK